MKVTLSLNNRMNQDANPMYVNSEKGEVLERRNMRITTLGDNLINVSLKGMSSIGTTTGLGTVVGFTEDKKRNWGIYFIKDGTIGRIYAYSTDSESVIKILDNNFSFFNFDDYVDAKVVNDFLIWSGTPLRCINITRAVNYSNSTGTWKETYQEITDLNTRLAIPAPTDNLTATFGFNAGSLNNISGKTWQFAVQYRYKDSENSVLSGYSPLYVHPSLLLHPESGTNSENYLSISVPMGSTEVVSSILLARENQGQWFTVREFKKSAPTDSPVTYDFYDSTAREYVNADTSVLLNQNIPISASFIETAKNRLILGNVLSGYDHPDISLSLSHVREGVPYTDSVSDALAVTVNSTTKKIIINATGLTVSNGTVVYLGFDGTGDFRIGAAGGSSDNDFDAKYSFMFGSSVRCTSSSVSAVLNQFAAAINAVEESAFYKIVIYTNTTTTAEKNCLKLKATVVGNTIDVDFEYTLPDYYDLGKNGLELNSEYSYSRVIGSSVNANTFIGGSAYSVGVEYYDESGNTSGVESPTSVNIPYDETVYDNNLAIKTYYLNAIRAIISGTPPSWAKTYRYVCSKSTSFASVTSFQAGAGYIIERDGKLIMAVTMPQDLQYAYSEGDFVNAKFKIKIGYNGFSETGIKVLGTASMVEKDVDLLVSGNFLLIDTVNTALNTTGAVISIYKPLKENSEKIYYHASQLYSIVSGAHSVTDVTLKTGDAWLVRKRFTYKIKELTATEKSLLNEYKSFMDAPILPGMKETIRNLQVKFEEKTVHNYTFNPSFVENTILGNSVSNINLGKPTVALEKFKQKRLQELWYGGQLIENTGINDLRDFSNIGKLALSETDGLITGLCMSGDVLKVIQKGRETSVYIGKEQILNADGTMQLVASQGFLGTINRADTLYGSKHTQSIVTNERDLYYFDLDNGCVVRSSPNGQFPISSYGFTGYFKEKAEQVNYCINNNLDYNIRAYFDRKYSEYVIIFDIPDHREAIVFHESDNPNKMGWNHFLDLTKSGACPDMVGTVGQSVLSFIGATLWLHDKTTSYNSLYGENKALLVRSVVNVSPTQEKCLKALDLDCNEGLATTITTPITANNVVGQETVLLAGSYEARQGKLVSEVYQNIRLANGTNDLDQLYEGDDIQGRTIEIELSKTTTSKIELRDLTATLLLEH